jgi:hypothetical protein
MAFGEEIPITKELLIDWLREEVPDNAEMGIEVGPDGQLDLIAFSGKDQYILQIGKLPDEAEDEDEDEDEAVNEQLH